MERSESSDSDSNSSTSWVFVPDDAPLVDNNANAFHLDCSREPIQELTEQDFASAGSDFETESDGVSIISESDATSGEYESRTCENTSELKDQCETLYSDISTIKKVDSTLLSQAKRFLTSSNIVGVGVVLTAVFLGSYSFKKVTVPAVTDFIATNVDKSDYSDLPCKSSVNLDEIVDITIACTYRGKESKVLIKNKQIKQCVRDRYGNTVPLNPIDQRKINDEVTPLLQNKIEKLAENKFDMHTPDKINKNKQESAEISTRHKRKSRDVPLKVTTFEKPPKSKIFKTIKETKSSKVKGVEQSGEWYTNMHKARQHSRKQTNKAGIYIAKRVKNKWYFKWMKGREELRRRNIYKPYSSYLNN
uniref:Uncharacterized protein n=1 Tax=Photinus pyralis TaxID=7054 RepID=A0A1Y1MQX9_PHOPY